MPPVTIPPVAIPPVSKSPVIVSMWRVVATSVKIVPRDTTTLRADLLWSQLCFGLDPGAMRVSHLSEEAFLIEPCLLTEHLIDRTPQFGSQNAQCFGFAVLSGFAFHESLGSI